MTIRNIVFIPILTVVLFACSETTEVEEKEAQIESVEEEKTAEEAHSTESKTIVDLAKSISFTDKSTFTISKENIGMNSPTGIESFDLFLNNELLDAPIKLSNEFSFFDIKKEDYNVPNDAVFAYNTWYAGGGYIYYGIVRSGVLQIFRRYDDEGMDEAGTYRLYREIDPNVQTKVPDYYISHDSDENKSKDLMIAFARDGKALYAKYEGQSRHLELTLVKEESQGRNTIQFYDEIVNGNVNGTYKLTHSGNWDYAEYALKKRKELFGFTINHERTIERDTYRETPNF